MALPQDVKDRILIEISKLRRQAGLDTYPLDIQRLYDFLGLKPPLPLAGEEFKAFLEKTDATDADSVISKSGLVGCIDHETGDIFVDDRLIRSRWRFVAVHEAMHWSLRHNETVIQLRGKARSRKREMEDEATFAAILLLLPETEFTDYLNSVRPLVGLPDVRTVHNVAEHFGVTYYTACRRMIETTRDSMAMITIRTSRWSQNGDEPGIVMYGHASGSWTEQHKAVQRIEFRDVSHDAIVWRARHLLLRTRDPVVLAGLVREVRREFACRAEPMFTAHSVHLLLS